jgi:hypothetical protein
MRSNLLNPLAPDPTVLPEPRPLAITQSVAGGRVEELPQLPRQAKVELRLWLIRINSLKPGPATPQRKVHEAKFWNA